MAVSIYNEIYVGFPVHHAILACAGDQSRCIRRASATLPGSIHIAGRIPGVALRLHPATFYDRFPVGSASRGRRSGALVDSASRG